MKKAWLFTLLYCLLIVQFYPVITLNNCLLLL